jgi:transcriptional regulator with XRE-family HTH domain
MATRETRLSRGRRRGDLLEARTLSELRERRMVLGISQHALARDLGWSQANLWRVEAREIGVTVARMSEMASLLGLELSIGLHELGDPIRDKGQQALAGRFAELLSPLWAVTAEALLPMPGDLRAWDKLLRLTGAGPRHLVGVDLETRIRDIQALVRRTRMRERDGGVDAIVIVLSDSATNRRLVGELRDALGPDYATNPRVLLRALREGSALVGSGVVLI